MTDDFSNWLNNLKDITVKGFITKRITIMANGSLGEIRSLGEGLFEAKIRRGAGFRLYFINKGKKIIVLLCGGDKSTQRQDISKAKKLAKEILNA
ncbi:MAG: type II toxin-antitoxin system RelE/ParE family toxin [Spirochaetes bacterium]|nr:type II toxin-antitoxin system RelE/ParE family toxin [Spirochaetota bacterium]